MTSVPPPASGKGNDDVERALKELEEESLLMDSAGSKAQGSKKKTNKKKNEALPAWQLPPQIEEPLQRAWTLIKTHIEYYPVASSIVGALVLFFVLVGFIRSLHARQMGVRHHLKVDFSELEHNYLEMSNKIHHWCLFGRDTDCTCDDPVDPQSRMDMKGWAEAVRTNRALVRDWYDEATGGNKPGDVVHPDVIFVGDELVQGWHAQWMNQSWCSENLRRESTARARHFARDQEFWCQDGQAIQALWSKTCGVPYSSNLGRTGLALGVAGDRANNLLWRLRHGEMPPTLDPKVWWLSIGTNDLIWTGCSEEAVVLGILRVAEEIALVHPEAVVVVQAIMPRSNHRDGSLQESDQHKWGGVLRSKTTSSRAVPGSEMVTHYHPPNHDFSNASQAKHEALPVPVAVKSVEKRSIQNRWLWPSIQTINKALEVFCEKHDKMIYFDASELVLGTLQNAYYSQPTQHIVPELMPDFVHLSSEGYKLLQKRMQQELDRIIDGHDYNNDIEASSTSSTP